MYKKLSITFFVCFLLTQCLAQTKLKFSTFSNPEKFSLLGDAQIVNGNIRLTNAVEWQRGACWYKKKVPIMDGFEAEFKILMSKNGGSGDGADGIAFVIHNDPNRKGIGRAGEGLGYWGISNAFVIEFDTYDNEEGGGNHISYQTNGRGMVSRYNYHSVYMNHNIPPLKNVTRTVKVVYQKNIMKVYLSGKLIANKKVNLGQTLHLDRGKAFIGFTSATAGGYAQHEILEWKFTSKSVPRA